MTHTTATLDVSPETHAEIYRKLRDAGYAHALHANGTIDMNGLTLRAAPMALVPGAPKPDGLIETPGGIVNRALGLLNRYRVPDHTQINISGHPLLARLEYVLQRLAEADNRGAEAGMAWSEIAASAYRAYAATTGGVNFLGQQMPGFGALPRKIQCAWEAAVRHTKNISEGRRSPEQLAEMESSWEGWTQP